MRAILLAILCLFSSLAMAAVDINSASVAQLDQLPSIGPKTARAIVDYRKKNGGFKNVDELLKVKGIGEKTLLKLRPLVTVGAPPAAASGKSQR